MLRFERDRTADCLAYDAILGNPEDSSISPIARIEKRDWWETPKRWRWSLDLTQTKPNGRPITLYFDTLDEAKEGLMNLLHRGLQILIQTSDYNALHLR